MADEQFLVLEWRIKNFCLWDERTHGISLEQWFCGLYLFPRGLDGSGDSLLLQVQDNDSEKATFVDVSFIGSDGSLLGQSKVRHPKWTHGFEQLPPGPTFDEVARARKKCPSQKDTLTVLCLLKKGNRGDWYRGQTTLAALDISLRVPEKIFEGIQEPKGISSISYPCEDFESVGLGLFASLADVEMDDSEVVFTLKPHNPTESVLIHSYLCLRDADDSEVKYQESHRFFSSDTDPWILSDSFQKRELTRKGHSLIIRLKVVTGVVQEKQVYSLSEQCAEIVTSPSELSRKSSESNGPSGSGCIELLSKDLMCLYQDQEYADFHLRCGNVTFATHRAVLSARSPVFKSMLSSGMREAEESSMEIADLDVGTLGKFLAYLYSGTVEEDLEWEGALKLYYSADKYQVPSLKARCKAVLTAAISSSSVCSVLSLAHKHQDEDLLSASHQFLLENDYDVLKSQEWDSFMLEEPYLASQTVTRILLKKSKKGMKKSSK